MADIVHSAQLGPKFVRFWKRGGKPEKKKNSLAFSEVCYLSYKRAMHTPIILDILCHKDYRM